MSKETGEVCPKYRKTKKIDEILGKYPYVQTFSLTPDD